MNNEKTLFWDVFQVQIHNLRKKTLQFGCKLPLRLSKFVALGKVIHIYPNRIYAITFRRDKKNKKMHNSYLDQLRDESTKISHCQSSTTNSQAKSAG